VPALRLNLALQIFHSVAIVSTVSGFDNPALDRRTFLFTGFAAAVGASANEQTQRFETFAQWLNAPRRTRELALPPCLDRIRAMGPSIHVWVQVLPQKPTGSGKLSGIPSGVQDIIETRGSSTEYGSIWNPRRAEAPAGPRPQLRPEWYRLRLESKLGSRCCGVNDLNRGYQIDPRNHGISWRLAVHQVCRLWQR
jgi:hypothetical protein